MHHCSTNMNYVNTWYSGTTNDLMELTKQKHGGHAPNSLKLVTFVKEFT